MSKRNRGKLARYLQSTEGQARTVTNTAVQRSIVSCHTKASPVFTLGDATIWAGSRLQISQQHPPWSFYLCCAGDDMAPSRLITTSGPDVDAMIKRKPVVIPWMSLGWDDGTVPKLNKAFWEDLTEALSKIKGHVGVYCVGGHGRTGTALAILASLGGVVPAGDDPVAWLRKAYCEQVVETENQCAYVEMITGRKVDAEASWGYLGFSAWDDDDDVDRYTTATRTVVMGPKITTTAQNTTPSAIEPQATSHGKLGKPVTNAAGDITHYDYDDEEDATA